MKIQVQDKELKKAIKELASYMPKKGEFKKPILDCVLLDATSEGIYIYTFNMKYWGKYRLNGTVNEEGAIGISFENLKTVSQIEGVLEITKKPEKNNVHITVLNSPSFYMNVIGVLPDKFPVCPKVEGGVNKFTGNSNDFKSMLKKLSISLPSKGRSQGIEVIIKDNTISGMATDGNSLAYYKTDYQVLMPSYENTQITFRIALPTVLVEKIRTLHMDKTFVLSIDDRHLTIDTGKIQITAQKADDTIFPDCAELLTTQFTDLATIETKKFLSIVNPILTHIKVDIPHAPMMTIENDLMKFDIADKNGKGATCTLPCDYNGEKICIGFNPELILSYAKVLDDSSKYFAMHFDINDVACTVCKLTDGTDFIYFAMPCEIYNR